MTDSNELLWNHLIENEDWTEAARIQKIAQGIGSLSTQATEVTELIQDTSTLALDSE